MKLSLELHENNTQTIHEDLSLAEYETTLFELYLQELEHYFIDYKTNIIMDIQGNIIALNLFSDFAVCYGSVVDSIQYAKNRVNWSEEIWFCEQGSDFYLAYEIIDEIMILKFRTGNRAGLPNNQVRPFTATITTKEYVEEWQKIFKELDRIFMKYLTKSIEKLPV